MTSVQVFTGAIAGHQHSLTTSRIIAKSFGKQHKDVLRAIADLECSEDFNRRNFAPVEYRDAKGEARPEYQMTRDGFMFLAMGFTGARAAQMKEAFIAAFNAMEAALRQPARGVDAEKRRAKAINRRAWALSQADYARYQAMMQSGLPADADIEAIHAWMPPPVLPDARITRALAILQGGAQ